MSYKEADLRHEEWRQKIGRRGQITTLEAFRAGWEACRVFPWPSAAPQVEDAISHLGTNYGGLFMNVEHSTPFMVGNEKAIEAIKQWLTKPAGHGGYDVQQAADRYLIEAPGSSGRHEAFCSGAAWQKKRQKADEDAIIQPTSFYLKRIEDLIVSVGEKVEQVQGVALSNKSLIYDDFTKLHSRLDNFDAVLTWKMQGSQIKQSEDSATQTITDESGQEVGEVSMPTAERLREEPSRAIMTDLLREQRIRIETLEADNRQLEAKYLDMKQRMITMTKIATGAA